jgi:hypothetical protein
MPLDEIEIVALRAPVAAGVNWMLTEHVPAGGSTKLPAEHVVLTTGNSSGLLLVGSARGSGSPPRCRRSRCCALDRAADADRLRPEVDRLRASRATADAPPANVCR